MTLSICCFLFLLAQLLCYYHRPLRRTLQGLVRLSTKTKPQGISEFGGAKVRENQQEKELNDILMKVVGIKQDLFCFMSKRFNFHVEVSIHTSYLNDTLYINLLVAQLFFQKRNCF